MTKKKSGGFKPSSKFLLILVLLSVFLVSGQQGCPAGTTGGPGTTSVKTTTAAQKTGLDFSLVQGVNYIYSGKKIQPEETFAINVLIENTGEAPKRGELCVKDDIEDIYGGIKERCKSFEIKGAVYSGENLVSFGSTNAIFDEDYKYSGLPIDTGVNLIVNVKYHDQVLASTSVAVPEPTSERLEITQDPSPLSLSIEKTVSPREGGYKASFGVEMTNSNSEAKISTPDYKKDGLIFNPRFSQAILECEYTDASIKYVEFDRLKSTRFIRCSTLLPREQTTYPFVIDLIYGVNIEKKVNFRVEKEERGAI